MTKSDSQKIILSEDWLATIMGLALILFFLLGIPMAAPSYNWSSFEDLYSKVFTFKNLVSVFNQFVLIYSTSVLAVYFSGKSVKALFKVIALLFVIAQVAQVLAGNSFIKSYNLEAVIFCLILGLIISHSINVPEEWRTILSSEWYVKVGLVLLGTSVIFSDILKAGSLGLIQAVVVVFSVWYLSYWICRKLKIDDELTFMLSSAVSICGVSAAIATAGAIKGDSKKLSYVISLVLIVAIPMMIFMPYIARYAGLSGEVTGAWLGGTIDTTGAVVAAGTLAGETALKVSTIVKFSQNVLLGIAAFAISVYWTYTKNEKAADEKPSAAMIWNRFPKFVIGFILASLLFSFVIQPSTVSSVKDGLKSMQGLWFGLAFTAIGLETKFSDIFNAGNKKPLYAFLLAQLLNIAITLVVALILFGDNSFLTQE
ncbi:MAG TPA: putative sulfate exporter family transporter [Cyclobacteriaceae bacterium]|nr:putative sulfate exporter family transporter [Cyclobacteriaceae bacterium]